MDGMHYFGCVFGAMVLVNAMPHFIRGVTGRPFPTPFAKPPGRGLSSPLVNVVWAFFNFFLSYLLLVRYVACDVKAWQDLTAMGIGALLMSVFHALHFGKVMASDAPKK